MTANDRDEALDGLLVRALVKRAETAEEQRHIA